MVIPIFSNILIIKSYELYSNVCIIIWYCACHKNLLKGFPKMLHIFEGCDEEYITFVTVFWGYIRYPRYPKNFGGFTKTNPKGK